MDEATQAGWDRWVKTHIAIALENYRKTLTAAVGEAMSEYVRKRLTQECTVLRQEISALRADLTLATSIQRGAVAKQKRGSSDAS